MDYNDLTRINQENPASAQQEITSDQPPKIPNPETEVQFPEFEDDYKTRNGCVSEWLYMASAVNIIYVLYSLT